MTSGTRDTDLQWFAAVNVLVTVFVALPLMDAFESRWIGILVAAGVQIALGFAGALWVRVRSRRRNAVSDETADAENST